MYENMSSEPREYNEDVSNQYQEDEARDNITASVCAENNRDRNQPNTRYEECTYALSDIGDNFYSSGIDGNGSKSGIVGNSSTLPTVVNVPPESSISRNIKILRTILAILFGGAVLSILFGGALYFLYYSKGNI